MRDVTDNDTFVYEVIQKLGTMTTSRTDNDSKAIMEKFKLS